jgi:hypothetical protein
VNFSLRGRIENHEIHPMCSRIEAMPQKEHGPSYGAIGGKPRLLGRNSINFDLDFKDHIHVLLIQLDGLAVNSKTDPLEEAPLIILLVLWKDINGPI